VVISQLASQLGRVLQGHCKQSRNLRRANKIRSFCEEIMILCLLSRACFCLARLSICRFVLSLSSFPANSLWLLANFWGECSGRSCGGSIEHGPGASRVLHPFASRWNGFGRRFLRPRCKMRHVAQLLKSWAIRVYNESPLLNTHKDCSFAQMRVVISRFCFSGSVVKRPSDQATTDCLCELDFGAFDKAVLLLLFLLLAFGWAIVSISRHTPFLSYYLENSLLMQLP
jgi:hypothetical protein